MNVDEFFQYLGQVRAIASLRTPVPETAPPAIEAVVAGGFRIAEVAMNTAGAAKILQIYAGHPEVVVGAGTVLTIEDAQLAIEQGARFLTSPVISEPVLAEAAKHEIPMIPGVQSPTEMARAIRSNAFVQYLFPTPADGPAYVEACGGPFVDLRLVPATGVDGSNAAAFLRAGAFALAFGNDLFVERHLAERRFDLIEARATSIMNIVTTVEIEG